MPIPAALPLFAAWHAVLAYSLQLYFDFSGYSDMAIGLARMFNLRFPLNFNSPYKAQSVDRLLAALAYDADPLFHSCISIIRWPFAAMRRRTARRLPINRKAQIDPGAALPRWWRCRFW